MIIIDRNNTLTRRPHILVPSSSLTASSASLGSSIKMKAKPGKHCHKKLTLAKKCKSLSAQAHLEVSWQSKHSSQFQMAWRHPLTHTVWHRCLDLQYRSEKKGPSNCIFLLVAIYYLLIKRPFSMPVAVHTHRDWYWSKLFFRIFELDRTFLLFSHSKQMSAMLLLLCWVEKYKCMLGHAPLVAAFVVFRRF